MRKRAIAFFVVAGLGVALIAGMRTGNRADAAAGDCYAADAGPATPTVCQ